MKAFLLLCLLPLGTLGTLLGGYTQMNIDDEVIHSRIRPALKKNGLLGTLPILKVERQRLFGVTNYRVFQGIPGSRGGEECIKITCPNVGNCRKPKSCGHPHFPEPPIKTPADRPKPNVRPHLLGGQESARKQDVQGAVQYVVERMNRMSNSMYRVVAKDVANVTKQLVAGMIYRFTISLVSTECRNSPANKGKKLGECKLTDNSEMQQCRVAVWQKLNGDYSLKERKCGKMVAYRQRHLLGGDGHDQCHIYLNDFRKFKQEYKRLYGSHREEEYRFQTFCTNMKKITLLQKGERGSAVYRINKFADVSEEEFRKHYLTPKWDQKTPRPWMVPAKPANPQNDPIPKGFDWREHGAVTEVKNQGQCGSCWAFSTTGNIEGQWAIKKRKLVSLSEQELVDCDKLDDGCEGGLPSNAYEAITKLGGLESEKDYSYKGVDEKCEFNHTDVAVKIKGGLNISSDEEEMKAWLYKNGPISIGINAFAMQFYFGGISHPWKIFCNPESLDHGVLIVGYDVSKNGEPYWIVKNSWGADWGEKGYYLVYRGGGVCGLNRMCTSAIVN